MDQDWNKVHNVGTVCVMGIYQITMIVFFAIYAFSSDPSQ